MVIAHETKIENDVRDTLVAFLRDFDFADRLWMRVDGGHITFWLLTKPVPYERERDIYRANGAIYRSIPDARFDFLVVNPAAYDTADSFLPPSGAHEIPLR